VEGLRRRSEVANNGDEVARGEVANSVGGSGGCAESGAWPRGRRSGAGAAGAERRVL
jgi:hypothetical protein